MIIDLKFRNITFQCVGYTLSSGRQLDIKTKLKSSEQATAGLAAQITAGTFKPGTAPANLSSTKTETPEMAFTVKDLGNLPISIKVSAIFSGANYKTVRDNVLNALDLATVGELQTPDDGIFNVRVDKVSKGYDNTLHQYQTIDIDFIQAEVTDNTRDVLNETVEVASTNLFDKMTSAIEQLNNFIQNDSQVLKAKVTSQVTDNTDLLKDSIASGKSASDFITGTYEESLELIDEMSANANQFSDNIEALQTAMTGVSNFTATAFTSTEEAYDTLFDMSKRVGDVVYNIPADTKEESNQILFDSIFRISSINTAVSLLDNLTFASVTDVETVQNALFSQLDNIALSIADLQDMGQVFQSIAELRARIRKVLSSKLAALPNLTTITIKEAMPVEVLAYHLYGNINRAQEILDRNNISNRLFVQGDIVILEN